MTYFSVEYLTELVSKFHMQKALMSCPVFLDFIGLNCKEFIVSNQVVILAHNDIKRKIISELLNRSKESQISYELGSYAIRKIHSTKNAKTNQEQRYDAQSVPDQSLLVIDSIKLKKNLQVDILKEEDEEAPKDNNERISRLLQKL